MEIYGENAESTINSVIKSRYLRKVLFDSFLTNYKDCNLLWGRFFLKIDYLYYYMRNRLPFGHA